MAIDKSQISSFVYTINKPTLKKIWDMPSIGPALWPINEPKDQEELNTLSEQGVLHIVFITDRGPIVIPGNRGRILYRCRVGDEGELIYDGAKIRGWKVVQE